MPCSRSGTWLPPCGQSISLSFFRFLNCYSAFYLYRAEVEVSVEYGGAEEIPEEVRTSQHVRITSQNCVVAEMHVA